MQSMRPYNQCFCGRPPEMFDPFSLYFWDDFPFDLPSFRAPLLMAPRRPFLPEMRGLVPRNKIEYKETPEAHHFTAELPWVRKEDVMVKVDNDGKMLHVSAKSKHDKEENKENYHHMERGYGEFVSKFMLPPNSKPEHLRSCVDNGVLTITIPKQNQHLSQQHQHQHQPQQHQHQHQPQQHQHQHQNQSHYK